MIVDFIISIQALEFLKNPTSGAGRMLANTLRGFAA